MKNFISLLALITLFSFSVNAESPVIPLKKMTASIDKMTINQDWLSHFNQASVRVDEFKGVIQLYLSKHPTCGINEFCIPTQVEVIELEIISVEEDSCGAVIYKAEKDRLPVDGLKETLTVVDYRNMICEIYLEHMSKATYSTVIPWNVGTVISHFYGSPFTSDLYF